MIEALTLAGLLFAYELGRRHGWKAGMRVADVHKGSADHWYESSRQYLAVIMALPKKGE